MRRINLIGERFGKLVVIEFSETRKEKGRYKAYWLSQCDCGNQVVVQSIRLRRGQTKSCGCLSGEKHGMKGTSEYASWTSMKNRCLNINSDSYQNYGGRGITIWTPWINSFECFLYWMGDKPSIEFSIDRINNNGPYAPWNCRWANAETQANNRKNNVFIEYNGNKKTIAQWAHYFDISVSTFWDRLNRGKTFEESAEIS
jgi:hypothetical protein